MDSNGLLNASQINGNILYTIIGISLGNEKETSNVDLSINNFTEDDYLDNYFE